MTRWIDRLNFMFLNKNEVWHYKHRESSNRSYINRENKAARNEMLGTNST